MVDGRSLFKATTEKKTAMAPYATVLYGYTYPVQYSTGYFGALETKSCNRTLITQLTSALFLPQN